MHIGALFGLVQPDDAPADSLAARRRAVEGRAGDAPGLACTVTGSTSNDRSGSCTSSRGSRGRRCALRQDAPLDHRRRQRNADDHAGLRQGVRPSRRSRVLGAPGTADRGREVPIAPRRSFVGRLAGSAGSVLGLVGDAAGLGRAGAELRLAALSDRGPQAPFRAPSCALSGSLSGARRIATQRRTWTGPSGWPASSTAR